MSTATAPHPGWVRDVVWRHVYPRGLVGAEPSAAPDQPLVHRLGDAVGDGGRLVVALSAGDRVRLPAHGWAVLEG